jgi:hypothetical protein
MMINFAAAAYGRSRSCLAQGLAQGLGRELHAALDAHRASCELDEVIGCPICAELTGAERACRARRSWSTSNVEHDT